MFFFFFFFSRASLLEMFHLEKRAGKVPFLPSFPPSNLRAHWNSTRKRNKKRKKRTDFTTLKAIHRHTICRRCVRVRCAVSVQCAAHAHVSDHGKPLANGHAADEDVRLPSIAGRDRGDEFPHQGVLARLYRRLSPQRTERPLHCCSASSKPPVPWPRRAVVTVHVLPVAGCDGEACASAQHAIHAQRRRDRPLTP